MGSIYVQMALENGKKHPISHENITSQEYLAGEFSAVNEVQEKLFELLFEQYRTKMLDAKLSDVEKALETAVLMRKPEYQEEFQHFVRTNIAYSEYLELLKQVNPEIASVDDMLAEVVLSSETEILSVAGYRALYTTKLTKIYAQIDGFA